MKCIKPNNFKRPNDYDDDVCRHQVCILYLVFLCILYASHFLTENFYVVYIQVRYLGLVENVRVRRAGYAYRQKYELFMRR